MRFLILAVTASLLATPARSQSLPTPACKTAQADMSRAMDAVATAVGHVLSQSVTFGAIMQKKPEDRTRELDVFCRRETFFRYDAADVAFDDGTYRAHALRRACPASDQQARADQAIRRFAAMRAVHDSMRLRLRGECTRVDSRAIQKLTTAPRDGRPDK